MKKRFTILHDDNGNIRDLSHDLADFGRDSVLLDYVAAEDAFYIGLYKPFDLLYFEMAIADDAQASMDVKYFNGSSFVSVGEFIDDSKGLIRSGFVEWEKPSDWDVETINGQELYWIRLDFSIDLNPLTELQGIGIVWSTDQDLKEEYYEILDCLPAGASSFILKHQASKKQIVQDIRNQGKRKQGKKGSISHITEFDFLKPEEELRQASKFLTLSKIFFNIHDDTDGIYTSLAKDYKEKFEGSFENLLLTLDFDDDGIVDNNEELVTSTITLRRV